MTAAEIAAALGAAQRSGGWWRCICPVHGSRTGRSATLALRDSSAGIVVHCHAGCETREVLTELRRLGLLDGDSDGTSPASLVRSDERADTAWRIAMARRIWGAGRDARGTAVARYLAGRGIILPVPPSLRWAAALRRPDATTGPAMVARVDGLDGELIGVHRTWLARDAAGTWRRRDRASLGPIRGGAVRLAPSAETLMIGEGIETCLAAIQATGLHGWAALSTSGMVAMILPPAVRTVIILADHDRSGAGARAARAAAVRWLAEGRRVRIAMPSKPGTDMADVLAGCCYARVMGAADAAA
jgi:putative DNA primase/helicase